MPDRGSVRLSGCGSVGLSLVPMVSEIFGHCLLQEVLHLSPALGSKALELPKSRDRHAGTNENPLAVGVFSRFRGWCASCREAKSGSAFRCHKNLTRPSWSLLS